MNTGITSFFVALPLIIEAERRIYVSVNLINIGSDNGLSTVRRESSMWTNTDLLFIAPLGTDISEIWIEIQQFSFTKMNLKIASVKLWPFCLALNVS